MTTQELIDKFADAIAFAEGFYVVNSRAWRNNNPGNLTVDTTGTGIGKDGMFIIYSTAEDGFDALKRQIAKMLDGTSAFYNASMSIEEIAKRYASTTPDEWINWANNVASRLGVTVETRLSDLLTWDKALTMAEVLLVGAVLIYLISKYKPT